MREQPNLPSLGQRKAYLEIPTLRPEKILDVPLGIFGEAQHEIPLDLQLVNGFNCLMNLKKVAKQRSELWPCGSFPSSLQGNF